MDTQHVIRKLRRLLGGNTEPRVAVLEPDFYWGVEMLRNGIIDGLGAYLPKFATFAFFNAYGHKKQLEHLVHEVMTADFDFLLSVGPRCGVMVEQAVRAMRPDTPVLCIEVSDPHRLNLVSADTQMGKGMTSLVSSTEGIKQHLEHLVHLQPHLKRALIISAPTEENFSAEEAMQLASLFDERRVASTTIAVLRKEEIHSEVIAAVRQFKPEVMMFLKDTAVMAGLDIVLPLARSFRIPIYAADLASVTAGAAFGYGKPEYNIGFRAGEKAADIMVNGWNIENRAVSFVKDPSRLQINWAAMHTQGLELSESALDWVLRHGSGR